MSAPVIDENAKVLVHPDFAQGCEANFAGADLQPEDLHELN